MSLLLLFGGASIGGRKGFRSFLAFWMGGAATYINPNVVVFRRTLSKIGTRTRSRQIQK